MKKLIKAIGLLLGLGKEAEEMEFRGEFEISGQQILVTILFIIVVLVLLFK